MILSHAQLEEIALAVTEDFDRFFFGVSPEEEREYPIPTPIDQLAREYLGLEVVFAPLSLDGSVCGLTAYTDTHFTVEMDGATRKYPLKKDQIVLDKSFIQLGQVEKLCGKRRFTLAHECAHQILFQLESDEIKSRWKVGWTQNIVILEADLDMEARCWYLQAVQRFGWSKAELTEQIADGAHLAADKVGAVSGDEDDDPCKVLPVKARSASSPPGKNRV